MRFYSLAIKKDSKGQNFSFFGLSNPLKWYFKTRGSKVHLRGGYKTESGLSFHTHQNKVQVSVLSFLFTIDFELEKSIIYLR